MYENELNFAKNLAAQAKQISDKYYKTQLDFQTKSDDSPVTIADKEINQLVIEGVKEKYASDGVLGEEASWNTTAKRLWVCDPIDGTIAFSMGDPTFMFSIALVINGKPVVAVTCELATGNLYWAVKKQGAYLNGNLIKVGNNSLNEAWLVFPTNLQWLFGYQAMYKLLDKLAFQTNVVHGGVFKGMLVATGLADAVIYPESTSAWDMAAVKLIVDEAGGEMTDIDGIEHRYDRDLENGIIISNKKIHQDLLHNIRESLQ